MGRSETDGVSPASQYVFFEGKIEGLEQENEQLKALNAQLADALVFVRDNLRHNKNKGIGLSALVKLNKALSTPISQQYIKEQRAKDCVVGAAEDMADYVNCLPRNTAEREAAEELKQALDNLKEIEKGEE